jgi:ATP-binding cassette subfamily B (MDR/TAP) protein 1
LQEIGEAKAQDVRDDKKDVEGASLLSMFRFADKYDYLMMGVGTFGALCLGASTPLFILFWGDFTNVFG